jgi:hypothetical protein
MNARQLIGQGVNLGESVAHDHAVCRTHSARFRVPQTHCLVL